MLFRSRVLITCAVAAVLATTGASQDAPEKPIGEIFASDATIKGAVQLVGGGAQVMSGSSIGAGESPALLRLVRGGTVRVCPRTNLSLSSSHNGRDLMFGMNTGAVEADYTLAASADAILTPDFRILLAGPGQFHVAIGADTRGNTCVRPLPSNTASVIVSELMGDGTYQVKPDEQLTFEAGKLSSASHVATDCGCPAAAPVIRAAVPLPPPPPVADLRRQPPPPSLSLPLDIPATMPLTSDPAPPSSQEVHVEVDAPFVFSAAEPEPAPVAQAARLKFTSAPPLAIAPLPPPPQTPVASSAPRVAAVQAPLKKRGFLGKVRSFFASVFR